MRNPILGPVRRFVSGHPGQWGGVSRPKPKKRAAGAKPAAARGGVPSSQEIRDAYRRGAKSLREAYRMLGYETKGSLPNPTITRYVIGTNEYRTREAAIRKAKEYANADGEPVRVTVEKERRTKYSETKARVLGGSPATGFDYSEFFVQPDKTKRNPADFTITESYFDPQSNKTWAKVKVKGWAGQEWYHVSGRVPKDQLKSWLEHTVSRRTANPQLGSGSPTFRKGRRLWSGSMGGYYDTKPEALKAGREYAKETGRSVAVWTEGLGKREMIQLNPRGSKGQFQRCVEAVAKRGGAYDPKAVCAAQERKAGKLNPVLRYSARGDSSGWRIIDNQTGQTVRTVKTKSAARQVLASMNAKAIARQGNPSLESVLQERYGVNGLDASPIAISWAAEHLAKTDRPLAIRELSALNRRRERMGKIPYYPHYGSVLFGRGKTSARTKTPRLPNPQYSTAGEAKQDFYRMGLAEGKKERKQERPVLGPDRASGQGEHMARILVEHHGMPASKEREIAGEFTRGYFDGWHGKRGRRNPGKSGYTVKVRDHYEEVDTLAQARRRAKELADVYGYIGFVYKGGKLVYSHRPARRNPAGGAIAVSEEFHGRKVKAMVPIQQKRHYHKYLAELGELTKLVVESRDGKRRVALTGFDGAMLCANEDKNQLFIVGGDQAVDLKQFSIRSAHEVETLGEVTKIEYYTDKEHLGSEGGTATYVHKFRSTNEDGRHVTLRTAQNPDLIYHLRDKHLEFSGGSYTIRAEGIDK